MTHRIDYFFAPQSPWTYLGHARFVQMTQSIHDPLQVKPIDLGKVFSVSGGLPLRERPPQRQAYRLTELTRFSRHLQLPLNLHPKYFPVAGDPAARLIIAVDMAHGTSAALGISGAIFAALWTQEQNIADEEVLKALLVQQALPLNCLDHSHSLEVLQRYEGYTQEAIDLGVFGAPTYVVDGEMFWGQDRLEFVAQALS